MKKQEIKKLSKDEIVKNIDKLKKDLFNFRFQKMNSQVTNPAKIGETRKTIARLKTILKGKANASKLVTKFQLLRANLFLKIKNFKLWRVQSNDWCSNRITSS